MIDNFLDEEYFDSLVTLFTNKENSANQCMPWYLDSSVTFSPLHGHVGKEKNNLFYMYHMIYNENVPMSPFYEKLIPLLEQFGMRCLIRVKGNLYPNTETLYEHPMHVDRDFSHSGAILSLNTCDGYTKLKDGTKIDSVANRMLFFDANEEHCSTTTTNVPARININMNYIQEQFHEMI